MAGSIATGDWEFLKDVSPSQVAALCAFLVGWHGIVSFVTVDRLGTIAPPAAHVGLVLVFLSSGVLLSRSDFGFSRVVTSRSPHGRVARRLVLVSLIAPLLFGWLLLRGVDARSLQVALGVSLYVTVLTALFLGLTWISGASQERLEIARASSAKDLQTTQLQFQTFLDNANAAICAKDLEGRYLIANRHFCGLLHFSPEQVIGHTDTELFPAEVAERYGANDRAVLESGKPIEVEESASIDGVEHIYLSVKFPLLDLAGKPVAVCGISTDMTDQKHAEANAKEAKEIAIQANQAKSEFLSRMSHELRTPLNAVLGFSQLLQMQIQDASQKESLEHISRAGRHLLMLVNEVLDISLIEAGKLVTVLTPVNFARVIQEAVSMVSPEAQRTKARIEIKKAATSSPCVDADGQRLQQVLVNLLANAIKYGKEAGRIEVSYLEVEPKKLRIVVADDGPGIPAEKRDLLFSPFERLGAEGEGTGLGLALSKGMVEAMGGSIGIDEGVSKGTAFFFELRLSDVHEEAAVETLSAKEIPDMLLGETRTVLYVEDNQANVELMRQILSARPRINLIAALDADAGLAIVRQSKPDLLLLDLHLPNASGEDVLAELRSDESLSDLPIVIVSADATQDTLKRCSAKGASAFITKPFAIREVLHTIDQLLLTGE